MAQTTNPTILDEAISWHLRMQSGSADDWEAFTDWLEGDPLRSDAYDAVAEGHAAMAASAFPPKVQAPANDLDLPQSAAPWRWKRFAAIAAVLLVAALLLPMLFSRPAPYEVATAAGQHRTLSLADGGTITLNGSTRLILDRKNPRFVELKHGEAVFKVKHDDDHPFVVVSDDNRIEDRGTVFNVVSEGGSFRVEVAEGLVVYDPKHLAIPLSVGHTLRIAGAGPPEVGRANPETIASWPRGQLAYTNAPLSRVAGDISRTLGLAVKLDPALADMPFTGSIRVTAIPRQQSRISRHR